MTEPTSPRTHYDPLGQGAKSAPGLLMAAEAHMRARAATYDQPDGERSMDKAVEALNAITGGEMTESDGWLLLTLLKFTRDQARGEAHRDSLEDAISYSSLYGEARINGR